MAETAGEVKVIFAADTSTWSEALDKAQKQLDRLKGATHEAGQVSRKELGEARGAAAVLGEEIGLRLPRHVRNFVAELPGVASVMAGAFNAIAIFAIISALVEAGEKVSEFAEKNEEAARKQEEAYRSATGSMKGSNAELLVSATRLENQIAKLEHKPENGVAQALAEAADQAQKLEQRLEGAMTRYDALLKLQSPGVLGQALTFHAGTAYEQKLSSDHSEKLYEAGDSIEEQSKESERYRKALATRAAELDAMQHRKPSYVDADGKQRRTNEGRTFVGFGTNYENEIKGVQELQAGQGLEARNISLVERVNDDQKKKDQDQAKVDAGEAAKKAAGEEIKSAEELLAAIKSRNDLTSKAEADFWLHLAASAGEGSLVYREAEKRANQAIGVDLKQSRQQLGQDLVRSAADQQRAQASDQQISDAIYESWKADVKEIDEQQKKVEESAIEAFRQAEQSRQAAERIEEERIKLEVALGQLSRLQGAQQMQALHDKGFQDWQSAQRDFEAQFSNLRTPGVAQTAGRYGVQSQSDRAAVESATALGALKESAAHLAQEFTDTATIVNTLLVDSLRSFNDTILRVATGQSRSGEHPFRELGRSVLSEGAGAGLRFAEGTLLKSLLGNDPTAKLGSKSNPMYVRSADPLAAAGGSAAGGSGGGLLGGIFGKILGHLHGGGAAAGAAAGAGDAAGAGWMGFDGFADGGLTPTNMPILVGEEGPEIFTPTTSGRVIPNKQIGGSGDMNFTIDARGTDPALTKANFARALQQTHAAAVRDAGRALAGKQMRRPH